MPRRASSFSRISSQIFLVSGTCEIKTITKIIPTIQTLRRNITTDIDLAEINKLLDSALELAKYKIAPVALTDQNVLKDTVSGDGQFILSPRIGENNWTEVQQFIANPMMIIPTITP